MIEKEIKKQMSRTELIDLIAVVQDEAEKVKLLLGEIIEDYSFYEIASGYELKPTDPVDLEKTALLIPRIVNSMKWLNNYHRIMNFVFVSIDILASLDNKINKSNYDS